MDKELQALERLFNTCLKSDKCIPLDTINDYDTIKKALKTLEIIKNKKVDVSLLDGLFDYNSCENIYQKLTNEEKSLLKEILK